MIWFRLILAGGCVFLLVEVGTQALHHTLRWIRHRHILRTLDRGHRLMLEHEQSLREYAETLCLTNGRNPLHSADPAPTLEI